MTDVHTLGTGNAQISLRRNSLDQFVDPTSLPKGVPAEEKCTTEALQRALSGLEHVSVISASINRSGEFQPPTANYLVPYQEAGLLPSLPKVTNLPDYCDVRLSYSDPGNNEVDVTVWVPIAWNRRFLGTGGGGFRSHHEWLYAEGLVRIMTLPIGIRNGFAVAATDAGYGQDPRVSGWALNLETGELNCDLIKNWLYRSKHEMAVIGKAVTEAIHGEAPVASYFQGTSGGGRDALAVVQNHPEDYDGVWASDPAVYLTKHLGSWMWPPFVMNELGHVLPPEKMDCFMTEAINACATPGGASGILLRALDDNDFEASSLIGMETPAGRISSEDAMVMQRIWDGPVSPSGEAYGYRLLPGIESWGNNINRTGICMTMPVDGKLVPAPFEPAESFFKSWVYRDESWDWRTLTLETYQAMFNRARNAFAPLDTAMADLTPLRDSGHKLLLTQGGSDEVIFPQAALDYYMQVMETMGGAEKTREFVRFFLSDGDGHSHVTAGPGVTLANGMIALIRWVESGEAPDMIKAEQADISSKTVVATRPVCAWPNTVTYVEGDSSQDASFNCKAPARLREV